MAGVACLDGGVTVPSSCSLSVSMAEWKSDALSCWLLSDSMRELETDRGGTENQ